MTIAGKAVLVTGANRGIGRALAEEALSRGAGRVYAGTRQPLAHPDPRVTPLTMDVTNTAQIQAAARRSTTSHSFIGSGFRSGSRFSTARARATARSRSTS